MHYTFTAAKILYLKPKVSESLIGFKQSALCMATVKLGEEMKMKISFINLVILTALPEQGSTKSPQYPAAINLLHTSLALSIN